MENILVAGANGTTGKKIITLLQKSEQYNPVAMVRKEEQMEQFNSKEVRTVLGDLEKDLSHAVQGIDKVIFAAGSGGKNVKGVDQEGAKNLIEASKKERIKKFVMLSSMGADAPEQATELKEYLEAKHNADQYLDISGLTFTIVRPGALNNEEGTGKIKLKEKLNERGEISRQDVASTLVAALDTDMAKNQAFEILQGETQIEEAVHEFSEHITMK